MRNLTRAKTRIQAVLVVGNCDGFECGVSGDWSVHSTTGFAGVSGGNPIVFIDGAAATRPVPV